jgi:hypothetical protein
MPIDYNPKDAVQCWAPGDYQGTLIKVEDKTSKVKSDGSGGNPMQVWTFRAYHDDGREQLISDYVVLPSATFKIKQLALALNKKSDFEAGTFQADDYINADVKLYLVVDKQDGFDDKNKVKKVKSVRDDASVGSSAPAPTPARNTGGGGRPQRQPVNSPVGEDSFVIDDIPFFWTDHRSPV